jgi:hypothetical protein
MSSTQAICCDHAHSPTTIPGTHRIGDWEKVKLMRYCSIEYFTLRICKEHWKAAGKIILKCTFGKWVIEYCGLAEGFVARGNVKDAIK